MAGRLRPRAKSLVSGKSILVCTIVGFLSVAKVSAQTASPAAVSNQAGIALAKAQVTVLRDSFVKATVTAGFTCPIAPPRIVMEDVPSYGDYEEDTNTLKSSAWELLTEKEKGSFYRLTGPNATEETARKEFETGAHHWVFVHELGHWWQACRHLQASDPYQFESAADRVAAAYWKEHDPAIITHQRGIFEYVLAKVPAPQFQGQDSETYFNSHYPDKYASVQEYIWFQSKMCLKAFDETPAPTFAEALKQIAPERH